MPQGIRILKNAALALVCFAVLALALKLLLAASPDPDPAMKTKIDALLSPLVNGDSPGVAVLVKKDGKIFFEKGYGIRQLRTHAKIDSQTNFRLASFTKQFTAMSIMLLVHDGKLRYDDRLTEIFPDFPPYGDKITVRQLLNHTAGLPDYEDLMEKMEKANGPVWSSEHQIQDAEVLALLEQQSSGRFVPGTRWAYSNSGYVVLGLIVAKVSGMPFRDFLQKRIFSPAGMDHSIAYQKGINTVPSRALGYSKENGKFVETDQSSTSATLGDGGVYSNLEDLAKWDEALRKHALLSETEMAPALTPAELVGGSQPHWSAEPDEDNLAPGKPVSYGFGWFLDPYQSHARMWHTGTTTGFRTAIQRFPESGLTIVMLCNRTDLNPGALSENIANIALPSTAR